MSNFPAASRDPSPAAGNQAIIILASSNDNAALASLPDSAVILCRQQGALAAVSARQAIQGEASAIDVPAACKSAASLRGLLTERGDRRVMVVGNDATAQNRLREALTPLKIEVDAYAYAATTDDFASPAEADAVAERLRALGYI